MYAYALTEQILPIQPNAFVHIPTNSTKILVNAFVNRIQILIHSIGIKSQDNVSTVLLVVNATLMDVVIANRTLYVSPIHTQKAITTTICAHVCKRRVFLISPAPSVPNINTTSMECVSVVGSV
jgi:hypothetical protein